MTYTRNMEVVPNAPGDPERGGRGVRRESKSVKLNYFTDWPVGKVICLTEQSLLIIFMIVLTIKLREEKRRAKRKRDV